MNRAQGLLNFVQGSGKKGYNRHWYNVSSYMKCATTYVVNPDFQGFLFLG